MKCTSERFLSFFERASRKYETAEKFSPHGRFRSAVEIVDFKSSRKPDVNNPAEFEKSAKWIYILPVRLTPFRLFHIRTRRWRFRELWPRFDDAVYQIMKKEFHKGLKNILICRNRDFRHYCMI